MKKQVFKFTLENFNEELNEYNIDMPKGAILLYFDFRSFYSFNKGETITLKDKQTLNKQICIWALVDAKAEKEKRFFSVFNSGEDIDMSSERNYIGTYVENITASHLFENVKPHSL